VSLSDFAVSVIYQFQSEISASNKKNRYRTKDHHQFVVSVSYQLAVAAYQTACAVPSRLMYRLPLR
jgi:hypothetical protein